jgi:hypothetical protein
MPDAELHLIKAACTSEEVTPISANSQVIAQMKGKFETSTKRREEAQILIILPHNWSVREIECGASYHMVIMAKEL